MCMKHQRIILFWTLWSFICNVYLYGLGGICDLNSIHRSITTDTMKLISCTAFADGIVSTVNKQNNTVYTYDREQLFKIRSNIQGKAEYKTLNSQAVINIRKYRIFRRLNRGGKWKKELLKKKKVEVRTVNPMNLHVVKCDKPNHIYNAHHNKMKMSTVNVQSLTSGNKDMVISDIRYFMNNNWTCAS